MEGNTSPERICMINDLVRQYTATEVSLDGIAMVDKSRRYIYSNQAYTDIYGYNNPKELLGKRIFQWDEENFRRMEEFVIPLVWENGAWTGVVLGKRLDGSNFHQNISLSLRGDAFVCIVRDLTESGRINYNLLSLKKALENMQTGLTVTDIDRKIIYVNNAEAEMHGYTPEELIGKDSRILSPAEIWKTMPNDQLMKRYSRESINIRKDGSTLPVHLMSDIVTDNDGRKVAIVTTCNDISERKKNEETIRRITYYDTLTELPNRMLFTERLQQAISDAHGNNKPIAVMLLDLDRFKVINDTYEHGVGDLLIKLVGQRLQSIMRECDTVARLGGDEFLLLFPSLKSTQDATVLAQKIIKLFATVFLLDSYEIYITASIGITIYPTDGADASILIKNADSSMYHAKEKGGNDYKFYSPSLDFKCLEQLTLGNSLHKAVEQNELLLHYQPQIDLSSGRIFGVETLVRWQHPVWGLMSPTEFIALAEDIGIIIPISEWVMRQAFNQMQKWGAEGIPLSQIAVNLSVRQFKEKNLFETISELLKTSGLNPSLLELEITESIIMQNPEETIATIRNLRSLGISFSIDDFGTGYSSLNYLKYLPVSRLKIAKCFIDGISTDTNDRTITKTIINLAHNLGMKVIAEGVETFQQLEFLRRYDCDEIQGYLFYKPLSSGEIERLLTEQNAEQTLSINTSHPAKYNILL